MYPMTPTFAEKFAEKLSPERPGIELIKKVIREHDTRRMNEGTRYYNSENDILFKERYAVIDGMKVVDEDKPNNTIPHGWHKLLVDQKTAYLVGNPISFDSDDRRLMDWVEHYLGERFNDAANELVKNASNKGKEWLHPYVDEEGEFDYIIVPAEQCIPIYEDKRQTQIKHMIRYYPVVINNETITQVEVWSDEDVVYYVMDDQGGLMIDASEDANPRSHFYYVENQEEIGYGWGKVPFIAFRNNEEEKSDLEYYKKLIDAYDNQISNNQNSFDEIQELIMVIKGYEGERLSEFMKNLKYYKAISVAEDGGVDTLQAETPMTGIDSHLDRIEGNIYTFGQGVNTQIDNIGNVPSGVALKFLYSSLDLKSDMLERKFRVGLQELMWFLCEYLAMEKNEEHDYKSVNFTFDKSMISNDLENVEMARDSVGVISMRTIRENHPFVTDPLEEERRIEEEKENSYRLDDDE